MEKSVRMPSSTEIADLFDKVADYRKHMTKSAAKMEATAVAVHNNRFALANQIKGVAGCVNVYRNIYSKSYLSNLTINSN